MFQETTAMATGTGIRPQHMARWTTLPPMVGRIEQRARRRLAQLRRLPVKVGYFRAPFWASAVRKRWVKFRNPHATIEFGAHTYLGPGFSLHMPFGGTFITGESVEFRRNFRAELGPEGRIEIGAGSYLTYDVIMSCGTSITIGERCGIGQNAYLVDGNHRYRDLDEPFLDQGYDYRPIVIEDDVADPLEVHDRQQHRHARDHRCQRGGHPPIPPVLRRRRRPGARPRLLRAPGGEPPELSGAIPPPTAETGLRRPGASSHASRKCGARACLYVGPRCSRPAGRATGVPGGPTAQSATPRPRAARARQDAS